MRLGYRSTFTAAAICALLVLASCGTRRNHGDVVAAAGGEHGSGGAAAARAERAGDVGGAADGGAGIAVKSAGADPNGSATATSTPAPTAPAGDRSPILVGNVGSYSGFAGAGLGAVRPTLQAWAQSVNARGGINGHPVKVISADDGASPSQNQAVTQDMVERQHVVGFVGSALTFTFAASRSYLEQKRVPVIGGDLNDDGWYESPMFFPQGQDNRNTGWSIVHATVASGSKKLGVIYCIEVAGCEQSANRVKTAAPAQGVDVVYEARVSFTQPDFTAECLRAKSAGAEALLVFLDPNALRRVAAACHRQSYDPVYVAGSATVNNSMTSDPNIKTVYSEQATFPWFLSTGPAAEYQSAMRRYAPGVDLSSATSAAWSAGKLFEIAATRVKGPITSASLLDALWSMRDETVGGLAAPITFRRDQAAMPVNCSFVVVLKSGTWTAPQGLTPSCRS